MNLTREERSAARAMARAALLGMDGKPTLARYHWLLEMARSIVQHVKMLEQEIGA